MLQNTYPPLKILPYSFPTVFRQAPDLISPSELEKTAAERYADGAFAQGAYLKAGLDGVLKSLPVLKIFAQDSFGLYTCPGKKAEAVLWFAEHLLLANAESAAVTFSRREK